MTYRVFYQLACEQPEGAHHTCPRIVRVEAGSLREARRKAAAQRWTYSPVRGDRCPLHRARIMKARQNAVG
jgi:hypothetical protein